MVCARRGSVLQCLSFLKSQKFVLIVLSLVCLGMLAMPASAQIALDATSSSSAATASFTWNHALGYGSGNNRLVICGVEIANTASTAMVTPSVTFNGVAMTFVPGSQAPSTSAKMESEMFYMLDANLPSSAASYPVVVTFATAPTVGTVVGCTSVRGANQAAPEAVVVASNGSGGNPTATITTKTNGAWVFDASDGVYSSTGKMMVVNSPQIQLYNVTIGTTPLIGSGSYESVATAGAVTVGWTGKTTGGSAQAPSRYAYSVVSIAPSALPSYSLTTSVSPSGAGTVAVSPNQSTFTSGASVTLTATPATGYVFSGWTGDQTSSSNPLTFNISANTNVVANFTTAPTCTLTMSAAGNGTVSPGTSSYFCGQQVTISATANSGSTFTNWTGDFNGSSNPWTITLNSNATVTGNFTSTPQCTLTTTVNGQGTVTGAGTYDCGTVVPLTASPASNWAFTSWSGGYTGTDNPTSITLNANTTVAANFTQTAFPLNITTVGTGTVTASPSQSYYPTGTVVTLTANPPTGGYFVGWSGDLTGTTNPATVTVNSTVNVTATFALYQITKDAASHTTSTAATSTLSWTHTLGAAAGTNRAVVIAVASVDSSIAAPDPNAVVTSVTFGGVFATPLPLCVNSVCSYGGGSGMVQTQLFYVLDSALPGPGSYPVVVNFTGVVTGAAAGATSFTGVSQGLPEQEIAAVVTSGSPKKLTTSVTTQNANDWVIDIMADGTVGATPNVGSSQTVLWSGSANVGTFGSSTQTVASPGTVTMAWSPSSAVRLAQTVLVLSPATATAPPAYTLNMTVSPASTGTVTLNPNLTAYPQGTAVLVTATAGSGSSFQGWTGDVTGTTDPLVLTMSGNYNVTANFAAVTMCALNFTISPAGAGTVSPASGTYPCGTQFSLTATGATGYSFNDWTGDITSTDNPADFTLTADTNITAEFVTTPIYTLTTNVNGQGTVTPASGSYSAGSVTLTAAAANGWAFTGWSGDYTGTANPVSINLSTDMTVTANFAQVPMCTLTMNVVGSGTVSPGSGSYPCAALTLTATPADGWGFSAWSGGYTGNTNPANITLSSNLTVTATFVNTPGDPRAITEPSFPTSICTVLTAQQVAGSLVETAPDTARVQAALNACPSGSAVEFSAAGSYNAFLIAPITLPAGVTMLVDGEVTIFGSIQYADYSCTQKVNGYSWCTPLITVAPNANPHPGSAIMGYGVIDGRGGWTINGLSKSWWSWGSAWRPRVVFLGSPATQATADNFTMYKITLQNAPMYHLTGFGNNLIVWDVKVTAPSDSPNTDGLDPFASSNITMTDSYISVGDDYISLKDGTNDADLVLGTSPIANVTVSNIHAYTGHGISMGSPTSAGISNVLIDTVNIDNVSGTSAYAMRIKSAQDRGGLVKNITYQNFCLKNGGDTIYLNPFYNTNSGTLYPNFQNITIRNVHQLQLSGKSMIEGFSSAYPVSLTLDNVAFDGGYTLLNLFESSGKSLVSNANITLGPGPVSFAPLLETLAATPANNITVTYTGTQNSNAPRDCSNAFVYLAPELYAENPSVPAGGSLTLTAILQPIIASQTMKGAAAAAGPYATPTGTIKIYDGGTLVTTVTVAAHGATFTNSNQRSLTYIPITNVASGTHVYTATYSGDSNYAALNFGPYSLTTMASAAVTVTATHTPANPVYGQTVTETTTVTPTSGSGTPSGTVTLTVGGVAGSAQTLSSGSVVQSLGSLAVGTTSITASYSGDSSFQAGLGADSVVVVKAPLTITGGNISYTYGGVVPAPDCAVTGAVNGDVITCTATVVGSATVPVASGSALSNYTVTAVNGTVTELPAVLTITAGNVEYTYGAAVPTPTCEVAGAVNGDVITCTAAISGSSTVPTADTSAVLANYTVTPVNGTVTVDKAALTIMAGNLEYTYGATVPTPTCVVTGAVNGDTITCTAAVSGGSTVPTASASAALVNYTITSVNGTVKVDPVDLVCAPGGVQIVYGQIYPAPPSCSCSGAVNGEQYSCVAQVVGSQVVVVSVTPTPLAAHYNLLTPQGAVTITPATLTAIAGNVTYVWGAPVPTPGCTVSGAVNGDVFTCTAAIVGDHTEVVSIHPTPDPTHYSVTTDRGVYTVPPTPVLYCTQLPSKVIFGDVLGHFTCTSADGEKPVVAITGAKVLNAVTAVGSYNADIQITGVGTITINAKQLGTAVKGSTTKLNAITLPTQTITVGKKEMTITIQPNPFIFRANRDKSSAPPTPTYDIGAVTAQLSYQGTPYADKLPKLIYSIKNPTTNAALKAGDDLGVYPITSTTVMPNYNVTILPATLTYTAAVNAIKQSPAATANTLTFKDTLAGTTQAATLKVTLANLTGAKSLTFTPNTLSNFSVASNDAVNTPACTVARAGVCVFTITFSPKAASLSVVSETLNFAVKDNVTEPGSGDIETPITYQLRGNSLGAFSVTAPAFDTINNGTTQTKQITITNNTTYPMTVVSVASTDAKHFVVAAKTVAGNACMFGAPAIAAGASCNVDVTFVPIALVGNTNSYSATINVTAKANVINLVTGKVVADTLVVQSAAISGQSTSLVTDPAATPITGLTKVAPKATVSFVNQSNAPVTVTASSDSANFTVPATTTIAPGKTVVVTITMVPGKTDKTPKSYSGNVTFTDSFNNTPVTISVSGGI